MAFLSCDSENIDSLFKVLTSQLFYYWMTKNVHEYGESGFRLSNQYVQEFSAPTTKIKDECEIYEYYHLTKEEISYIKMIK